MPAATKAGSGEKPGLPPGMPGVANRRGEPDDSLAKSISLSGPEDPNPRHPEAKENSHEHFVPQGYGSLGP
jgi:hypothetical protein